MDATLKAAANGEASPDLRAIISDIASLKTDLAALAGHLKAGAVNVTGDAARNAVGQLGDQASRVYDNLAAQGRRSAEAIGRQVEEQPIMTLLLAFALGFIGSRLLSR